MSSNIYIPTKEQIAELYWEDFIAPSWEDMVYDATNDFSYFDWTGIAKTEEHKKLIGKANSKPKTGKALKACIENAKLGAEARRGQKDTMAVRKKRAASLSKALTGIPQLNRRKVIIINGEKYIGAESVCEKYNITRQTVYNRIKSNKWNWYYE